MYDILKGDSKNDMKIYNASKNFENLTAWQSLQGYKIFYIIVPKSSHDDMIFNHIVWFSVQTVHSPLRIPSFFEVS